MLNYWDLRKLLKSKNEIGIAFQFKDHFTKYLTFGFIYKCQQKTLEFQNIAADWYLTANHIASTYHLMILIFLAIITEIIY